MPPLIEDGSLVLFQGDSITDAERHYADPLDMGVGYAQMAANRPNTGPRTEYTPHPPDTI